MSGIEDARTRRDAAEERLKSWDYAGAIREAGKCVELSLKALLDMLSIDYTIERHGKRTILHDVSKKIPKAFEKLQPYLEDYEITSTRLELARAMVLHRLLSSIRDYVEYPIKELEVDAKDVFRDSKELTTILVGSARSIFILASNLINKIKRRK